jgi:hypothetical protein
VNYVVLRNYQNLPEEYGNDIDLLLKPSDFNRAINVINSLVKEHGLKVNRVVSKYCYTGIYIEVEDKILLVDLFTNLVKGWVEYSKTYSVLENKCKRKNFYIPKLEHELAIIMAKEVLTYNKVRTKYERYIYSMQNKIDKDFLSDSLKGLFTSKSVKKLYEAYISKKVCETKVRLVATPSNILKPIEVFHWLRQKM